MGFLFNFANILTFFRTAKIFSIKVLGNWKVKSIQDKVDDIFVWVAEHSKNQKLLDLVDEMKAALQDPSVTLETLKKKADALKKLYDKEHRAVQGGLDLEARAKAAMAYAEVYDSKLYRRAVDDLRELLDKRTGSLASAEKKADKIIEKYKEVLAREAKKRGKSEGYHVETLDELRARMKSQTPETVNHLDRAISAFEKSGKYGDETAAHAAEVEAVMRDLFAKHDYGMNISDSLLQKVLDTKFKNTFEVGASGGYNGSSKTTGPIEVTHGRLKAAHNLFGLGKDLRKDQLSRAAYEKYGNLLDHDILRSIQNNTAKGYGNVEVRFKKDKVVCTWTAGDSLGQQWQPTLTTDPKACSYDDVGTNSRYISLPTKASDTSNLVEFKKKHISGYLELQYHGELGIDAVESLTFPYDITQSRYLAVANKWKTIGVKIYYKDKNGLLKEL